MKQNRNRFRENRLTALSRVVDLDVKGEGIKHKKNLKQTQTTV